MDIEISRPNMVPSEGTSIPADLPDSLSQPANAFVRATARREEEEKPEEDAEILRLAHLRFHKCIEAETNWRHDVVEELDFVDGLEHWTEAQRQERIGRPCLVFDRIGPSIDQVVNNARQAPPEPRVSPVGDNADKETAEILQGLIRNIENDSGAEIAYMTAYEHAVKVGRGWWRILFEYENDEDDTQKIIIRRVPNLFSVYPDPAAEEWDYSDMRFAFVTEDLDKDIYDDLYPESRAAGLSDFEGIGDRVKFDWFPNGGVRIAEYWWVETKRWMQATLQDGRRMPVEEVPAGTNIVSMRRIEKRKVRAVKLNGLEILERWDWPGRHGWIPLVPVLGREIVKNGKRRLRGMIRPAMDANLSYDYMRSKQVEAVGLAPLAPYLVPEGALEGHEQTWKNSNRVAYPFLYYKPQVDGQPVSPPHRQVEEPAIAAITTAVQFADNDIKATLATWDASLGRPGPEFSGKAIRAQQQQGDNAHFNYHDNLARSIRHTGRVILDVCPFIYSEQRLITIVDPDGATRQVPINKHFIDTKQGADRIYELGEKLGRYDIVIGSGPSFATRRQQGADALLELTRTIPQAMGRALDLVVKALDIPDADQLADRLRPSDVQTEKEGQMPVPPEIQAQMVQQQQMIAALTEQLNKLNQMVETKALERESAERIAEMEAQVKLVIEDLKSGASHSTALMQQQFAAIKAEMDALRAEQAQARDIEAAQQLAETKAQQQSPETSPEPESATPPPAAPPEPQPQT